MCDVGMFGFVNRFLESLCLYELCAVLPPFCPHVCESVCVSRC